MRWMVRVQANRNVIQNNGCVVCRVFRVCDVHVSALSTHSFHFFHRPSRVVVAELSRPGSHS